MPSGHIQDPRLNLEEQPFGFLIRHTDCHTYVYAKDETNRILVAGTPVGEIEIVNATVNYVDTTGNKRNFEMPLALNARQRTPLPVLDALSRRVKSAVEGTRPIPGWILKSLQNPTIVPPETEPREPTA